MKQIGRARRHKRVTKKLKGTAKRPRLVIFRSKKHIRAQLIDDCKHATLATSSTLGKGFVALGSKQEGKTGLKPSTKEGAKAIGKDLAEKALKLGIKTASFDRAGYKYHGRVKSLADGAREGGLKF